MRHIPQTTIHATHTDTYVNDDLDDVKSPTGAPLVPVRRMSDDVTRCRRSPAPAASSAPRLQGRTALLAPPAPLAAIRPAPRQQRRGRDCQPSRPFNSGQNTSKNAVETFRRKREKSALTTLYIPFFISQRLHQALPTDGLIPLLTIRSPAPTCRDSTI